jgi:hypothetical protein
VTLRHVTAHQTRASPSSYHKISYPLLVTILTTPHLPIGVPPLALTVVVVTIISSKDCDELLKKFKKKWDKMMTALFIRSTVP